MVSTILKLITGGLEAFWGIPILGEPLFLVWLGHRSESCLFCISLRSYFQ